MKHSRFYCSIIIIAFTGCSPKSDIDFRILKGKWINNQYLDSLKITYSPKRALGSPTGCIPYIEISDNNIQWLNCFHDGDGCGVQDFQMGNKPHTYQFSSPKYGGGLNKYEIVFDPFSPSKLIWKRPDTSAYSFLTFTRVGSIDSLVNSILISGVWRGVDGEIYKFTDSGWVYFKSTIVQYNIWLDWYGTDRDAITIGDSNYGFIRNDKTLSLTSAKYDELGINLVFDKSKINILKKIQ